MRALRVLGLLVVVGGCHLTLGFDGLDYEEATTTGSTTAAGGTGGSGGHTTSASSGSGGSASHCSDGTVEVPTEVPAGWLGLVVIARAVDEVGLPNCMGAVTLRGDLQAEPADCMCDCASPNLQACRAELETFTSGAGGCDSSNGKTLLGSTCSSNAVLSWSKWRPKTPADVCKSTVMVNKPPAQWGEHVQLCPSMPTNVDPRGCADAPPSPFESRLCIYRPGSHACPPAAAKSWWTYFEGIEDSRDCSTCACGPSGTGCVGSLAQHANAACAPPPAYPPANTCVYIGTDSLRYEAKILGGCTPTSQPQPNGEATPTGAVTICCTQ